MLLSFAEWAPDVDPILGGTDQIVNALPAGPLVEGKGAFRSFNQFQSYSSPLPSSARTAFSALDRASGDHVLYIGAGDAIYQQVNTAWEARSSGHNLVNSDWSFTQHRNKVIACALDEITLVSEINGEAFTPLFTSTLKPRAAVCSLVNRDSVVLGYTIDDVDGTRPSRIWFTASGNPADADPDVQTLCSFEDLDEDEGPIVAISGREYGIVYTPYSIWRMSFVGPPVIYRFDKMSTGLGLASKDSLVSIGRVDYGLNEQGFFAFDGTQVIAIGENRFNKFFWSTLAGNPSQVSGAFSYRLSTIFWAYPTAQGSSIITYNWTTGRASLLQDNVTKLFNAFLPSAYTDAPDYALLSTDEEPYASKLSDAEEFIGGRPLLLGYRDGNILVSPDGPPLYATLQTREYRPNPQGASEVKSIHSVSDALPEYVRIGSRHSRDSAFTYWTRPFARNNLGFFYTPSAGTYLRFEASFDTAFDRAIGLDVLLQEGILF